MVRHPQGNAPPLLLAAALEDVLLEHILPHLSAFDVGSLAASCKDLRSTVKRLGVQEWFKAAERVLPASHPLLQKQSSATTKQVHAALTERRLASRNLCEGRWSHGACLQGLRSEFSPDGEMMASCKRGCNGITISKVGVGPATAQIETLELELCSDYRWSADGASLHVAEWSVNPHTAWPDTLVKSSWDIASGDLQARTAFHMPSSAHHFEHNPVMSAHGLYVAVVDQRAVTNLCIFGPRQTPQSAKVQPQSHRTAHNSSQNHLQYPEDAQNLGQRRQGDEEHCPILRADVHGWEWHPTEDAIVCMLEADPGRLGWVRARVHDVSLGRDVCVGPSQMGPLKLLAWAPEAGLMALARFRQVIFGGQPTRLEVQHLSSGAKRFELELQGHAFAPRCSFSRTGDLALVTSTQLIVWPQAGATTPNIDPSTGNGVDTTHFSSSKLSTTANVWDPNLNSTKLGLNGTSLTSGDSNLMALQLPRACPGPFVTFHAAKWSPDGTVLALFQQSFDELFLYDARNLTLLSMVATPNCNLNNVFWSCTGTQLYYEGWRPHTYKDCICSIDFASVIARPITRRTSNAARQLLVM